MSRGLCLLRAGSATFTALWGQKCCHFDAVPQTEGCYTLLSLGRYNVYLGSFCAVPVLWLLVSAASLMQECCTQQCARAWLGMSLWTGNQIFSRE